MDVTVTTVGGTSTTSSADDFTYVAAPTVSGLSPTTGPLARRHVGDDHRHQPGQRHGGPLRHDGGEQLHQRFGNPDRAGQPGGTAGTVDVTVTTAGGTSATSSADQFTYVAAPTVSGMSPTVGPLAGGTLVTITGTSLTDATAVDFGTTAASSVTSDSATQITLDSPAGTGTVDVTVTTAGGTSATSSADHFTYVAAPTVTGMSPTVGPLAGGTLVTITGTNLANATAVDFGTTAATSVTVVSHPDHAGQPGGHRRRGRDRDHCGRDVGHVVRR